MGSYPAVSQGKVHVESIDDVEEMQIMDEAFDILGFTHEEKFDVYKVSATCMTLSKLEFQGLGEVATPKTLDDGNHLNEMLHFSNNGEDIYDRFINPKFKVGTEWVNKTQNLNSVTVGVASIIKNVFGRLFRYLVDMCNNTLIDPTMKKVNFIGVLDIAGFEIFEFNTFEQLCINFVNEKLQQFFNHHMFVLEQEEYMREGIQWVMIDFGMDLAETIELIEKPLGIMSILEEECMFPKATDMTFRDKLFTQHLGKTEKMGKPNPKNHKNPNVPAPHFELYHYAGTVGYTVTDWLLKNKDPLNGSVVSLLKKSTVKVVQEVWATH